MVQLTRLFVISRILFMGFLISGAAIAETSPIESAIAPSTVMDAAADDIVAQTIQASLAPLKTAFPPLLTSKRHRRGGCQSSGDGFLHPSRLSRGVDE